MPDYKCKFQNDWLKQYNWVQKVENDTSKAKCKICQSVFSIANQGINGILQHQKNKQTH